MIIETAISSVKKIACYKIWLQFRATIKATSSHAKPVSGFFNNFICSSSQVFCSVREKLVVKTMIGTGESTGFDFICFIKSIPRISGRFKSTINKQGKLSFEVSAKNCSPVEKS